MFGWSVAPDGPDVVVLDDNGEWQARFRTAPDEAQNHPIRLERGATSTIWLPGGPIDVFNGKPYALRRRSHSAQAMAGGHLYDFRPDSSRWTHLMRDGWSIARIHSSGRVVSGTAGVITFGELDVTDRLMVVLGQECIGPGRPGFAVSLAHLVGRLVCARLRGPVHRRNAVRGAGQNGEI